MPDRIALALETLAGSQSELATNIGDLAYDLGQAERRRRQESLAYKIVLGILLALIVAQSVAIGILVHTSADNHQTLAAVQGATGPEAQKRNAAGVSDILQRNAIETDCRSRRQQARLPAPPDPGKPCIVQTDLAVYPGIAGQPPKGP